MSPNKSLYNLFVNCMTCPIYNRLTYTNVGSKSCYNACFLINGGMLHILKPIQLYLFTHNFNLYAGYYNSYNGKKSIPIQLPDINNQSMQTIISNISKLITFS